jgi:hypothetical protein
MCDDSPSTGHGAGTALDPMPFHLTATRAGGCRHRPVVAWRTLATAIALGASAASALAAGLVQNGGFEVATNGPPPGFTALGFSTAGVQNWSNSPQSPEGDALVVGWTPGSFLFPNVGIAGALPLSPQGGNFVFSDGNFQNSMIQQTLTGLTPGGFYTVTFWQALAQDTEPFVTVPGPVTGGWRVSLGTSSWVSATMSGNGTTNTFTNWMQQSATLQANSSTEVLGFLAFGTGDPPLVFLDGIDVAAVPEPTTAALWLLGGLVVAGVYRRTRWQRLPDPVRD